MRIFGLVFGVVLGACLAASPLWAQDVDCATAENQQDLNFCAEQEWMQADKALNDAYATAMETMKTIDADLPEEEQGGAKALKEAQRAWVTFRDAACTAAGYPMHGGSAEPLLIYGCRAQLTRQRTEDLVALGENY